MCARSSWVGCQAGRWGSTRGGIPTGSTGFYRGVIIMRWTEWQAVAEDESLWIDHEEKGLLKAEYLDGYVLRLWFEEELDVSIYELDFESLLMEGGPESVFELLKDKERFQRVRGDYALIWPNPDTGAYDEQAIDLAPECVRFFCEHYGKQLKEPQKKQVA